MNFISNPKFNAFFRIKATSDEFSLRLNFRILGFLRFKKTLVRGALLSKKTLQKLALRHENAIVVFDHQGGGGADFYLDERLKMLFERANFSSIFAPNSTKNSRSNTAIKATLANVNLNKNSREFKAQSQNNAQNPISLFYAQSAQDAQKTPTIAFIVFFKHGRYFIKTLDAQGASELFVLKNLNEAQGIFNAFCVREIFVNELVNFKHLGEVTDFICRVANAFETPISVPLHDYYPLCPRTYLLDENDKFCALKKDLNACDKCASGCKDAVDFKNVSEFRAKFAKLFAATREIITFSKSSQELLLQVFDIAPNKLKFAPHRVDYLFNFAQDFGDNFDENERNFNANLNTKFSVPQTRERERVGLRVGILGILAQNKGLNEVLKLLDLCEDLPFKFVLFGEICLETAPKKLAVLGKYDRTTLQTLVKAYEIDIFLIPSICPETFSYTTHEVIALGYPLVCFALGAQAESVGAYDKGQIAKDISAKALKDELVKFYERCKRV